MTFSREHFPNFYRLGRWFRRRASRVRALIVSPRYLRRLLIGLACVVIASIYLWFAGFYTLGRITEPVLMSLLENMAPSGFATSSRTQGYALELNVLAARRSPTYRAHLMGHVPAHMEDTSAMFLIEMLKETMTSPERLAFQGLIRSTFDTEAIERQGAEWRSGVAANAHTHLFSLATDDPLFAAEIAEAMLGTLSLDPQTASRIRQWTFAAPPRPPESVRDISIDRPGRQVALTAAGEELSHFPNENWMENLVDTSLIDAVALNRSKTRLACAFRRGEGIIIFDLESRQSINHLPLAGPTPPHIGFFGDDHVAIVRIDSSAAPPTVEMRVWSISTQEEIDAVTLNLGYPYVNRVAFRGNSAVVGSAGQAFSVVEFDGGQLNEQVIATDPPFNPLGMVDTEGDVLGRGYNPDGTTYLALWDAATQTITRISSAEPTTSTVMLEDSLRGRVYVEGIWEVIVYDTATWEPIESLALTDHTSVAHIFLSADGERVIVQPSTGSRLLIYEASGVQDPAP